jgi:hypothetical protein
VRLLSKLGDFSVYQLRSVESSSTGYPRFGALRWASYEIDFCVGLL